MTSTDLNSMVTFGYMGISLAYLVAYVLRDRQQRFLMIMPYSLVVMWGIHTGSIALRWVESYSIGIGHAPLSNLYESLVFFAWSMALALILINFRFKTPAVVVFGLPLVFLVMASTFLVDTNIRPLIPALQSNWLVIHVVTCFLGYAGFAASFVAAVILLVARSSETIGKRLPAKAVLDEIVYRSVLLGFPLLSVGIITGAAWADHAWGSYWSWDPKETWSLITWMVYSAFLHARLARGWSGGRTAILSVLGFGAVIFTYFGVNYLPGLHSYF